MSFRLNFRHEEKYAKALRVKLKDTELVTRTELVFYKLYWR